MTDRPEAHYSQGDLFTARAERDAAMQQAVDHADAVEPSWSEQAQDWVRKYVAVNKSPFVCDELRIWAEERGCPAPVSGPAWGSVMAKSARLGIIAKVGLRTHIFPDKKTTHMKAVTEWIGI